MTNPEIEHELRTISDLVYELKEKLEDLEERLQHLELIEEIESDRERRSTE